MKTVELIYVGPELEVEVPAARLIAAQGKPFTVTDKVAKALLADSKNWREAYPPPVEAASKKPAGKTAKKAKG